MDWPSWIAAAPKSFPDFVLQAFNEMIQENLRGYESKFNQSAVVERIVLRSEGGVSRDQVFANRWLDVESLYERHGWTVAYDKPAYNEDYPATFTFKIPPDDKK